MSRRKMQVRPTDPMVEGDALPKPRGQKTPDQLEAESEANRWMPRFQIRTVAEYAARVLVANVMDYYSATRALIPQDIRRIMSNGQVTRIREAYETSSDVQREVEKILESSGLDENSKEAFVKEMWTWFRGERPAFKMKAASILGRGFIGEKVLVDKPEDLPIEGFKEGLEFMLGAVPDSTPRRSAGLTSPPSAAQNEVAEKIQSAESTESPESENVRNARGETIN